MKTQTIKWSPFSDKHKKYIRNALNSRFNVAEGAIRSGKTIDHCIIAAIYLETCEDKIHLASGSSLGNAKLNIGDCNGFGLEHLFRGRCKWGEYKGNDCLYIKTKTGEKVVIFAGGGKRDSYKRILGNSYGLWIATEINEHYDSDDSRESFIKVAMGRQIASKSPFTLWDLNPCNPHSNIYTEYIDRYKDTLPGYNYEHFTMNDNLSVSEERRQELKLKYTEGTVWYRRDILGERCVAEGIIYQDFADNSYKFRIPTGEEKQWLNRVFKIVIGVDFGGNNSATTFVCTGFTFNYREAFVICSERIKEQLDPEELNTRFKNFVNRCYYITGKYAEVRCDSAEQILIKGLRRVSYTECLPVDIRNAIKRPINERIRFMSMLIAQKRFYWFEGAKTVKDAMCEAIWDSKHPDERLDDGTSDIDTLDALEYSLEPDMVIMSEM